MERYEYVDGFEAVVGQFVKKIYDFNKYMGKLLKAGRQKPLHKILQFLFAQIQF